MKSNNSSIRLNEKSCTNCQSCIAACSYGALTFDVYPQFDFEACTLCNACVDTCPNNALHLYIPEDRYNQELIKDGDTIWVVVELNHGRILPVVFELIAEANRLSIQYRQHKKVVALLMGEHAEYLIDHLFKYGTDQVYYAHHPRLNLQLDEDYASVLADLATKHAPSIILVGATSFGKAVSARAAALLHTGLTADCTALHIDPQSENLIQTRPTFGGNLIASIETKRHRPQMASVRQGVMKTLEPNPKAKGETIKISIPDDLLLSNVQIIRNEIRNTIFSLSDAQVIVAGGKGMKTKANFDYLNELASLLGGQVGGSRVAVDKGWITHDKQIGMTGLSVSPKLYIACGISGQIQHMSAVTSSDTIIAINNDPDAPIFQYAQFGILGNVEEILPLLIAELKMGEKMVDIFQFEL
jgi:electron transfer flavoprotein alpha subunit